MDVESAGGLVKVTMKETQWSIARRPAVAVGARAEGEDAPQVQASGLVFHSSDGETLFYPMAEQDLPTEKELAAIPLERIAMMMAEARARPV
jgi:hypothetical protein